MAILTATEVSILSNISASAVTIANSGLIPIIQDKIGMMLNNYFTTDLYFNATVTFNASARSVITDGQTFEERNFLAGDDVYIYNSYRNDGYFTLDSVSGTTAIFVAGSTVVDELSGRSIMFSIVKWPKDVKQTAAQMIAYDYDVRPKLTPGITSRSLGPLSESFSSSTDEWGYPKQLTDRLVPYRIARLM